MSKEDIRAKILKEKDVADWPMLHSSFVRNSLFLVHGSLDLVEAALAVANDEGARVEAWISEGQIARPDGYQVEAWRKKKQIFECVVVSPYVFICEVSKPEEA